MVFWFLSCFVVGLFFFGRLRTLKIRAWSVKYLCLGLGGKHWCSFYTVVQTVPVAKRFLQIDLLCLTLHPPPPVIFRNLFPKFRTPPPRIVHLSPFCFAKILNPQSYHNLVPTHPPMPRKKVVLPVSHSDFQALWKERYPGLGWQDKMKTKWKKKVWAWNSILPMEIGWNQSGTGRSKYFLFYWHWCPIENFVWPPPSGVIFRNIFLPNFWPPPDYVIFGWP